MSRRNRLLIAGAIGVAGCTTDAVGTGSGGGSVGGAGGDCFSNVASSTLVAGPPPTLDNSADLRGVVVGALPFDATAMRRMVPVTVGTPLPGIQVGAAYLTRSSATTETAYLTIPVTNTGGQRPCFIKASPLNYLNGSQLLNDAGYLAYVSGSVGDVVGSTETCLGPGETGYIIDIQLDTSGTAFFSGTTSIALSLGSSLAGTLPAGRLHPTRYEVGVCSTMRSIRLTAVNDGAAAVDVAQSGMGFNPVVLLDGGGLPAGWLYFVNDAPLQIAAGAMLSLTADLSGLPSIDRARFFMEFAHIATTASVELASIPDDVATEQADVHAAQQRLLARWRSAQ